MENGPLMARGHGSMMPRDSVRRDGSRARDARPAERQNLDAPQGRAASRSKSRMWQPQECLKMC
eukprot:2221637-Pyramimonas_sp.AAC.1